ncbi:MAG: hypothetical protein R2713_13320 [Ilumatobacteraceae bacterium]
MLQALCEEARAVEAGALTPDEQVTVAAWWCELAASSEVDVPLTGPELQALLAGVLVAADVGRWDAVGRLATRLWRTTRVPQAAVGVAAALARSAPTPLLDELLAAHPDDELVRVTATFSRALWLLYVDHRPDAARQLLETVLETVSTHRELCEDGLATVDLHTGDPDAVERRVGDRPPTPGAPTSFALHALALADLARGRHARVLGRLDDELERSLHPGMNLTADRYRFVRSLVSSRSGGAEPDERTELSEELRRLYEGVASGRRLEHRMDRVGRRPVRRPARPLGVGVPPAPDRGRRVPPCTSTRLRRLAARGGGRDRSAPRGRRGRRGRRRRARRSPSRRASRARRRPALTRHAGVPPVPARPRSRHGCARPSTWRASSARC